MHKTEGYALDWSPLQPLGKLLTGDNDGLIYALVHAQGRKRLRCGRGKNSAGNIKAGKVGGNIVNPPSASKPLSTLRMHKTEGYALDWSPLQPLGKLLTERWAVTS
jgi:hypothetical protein